MYFVVKLKPLVKNLCFFFLKTFLVLISMNIKTKSIRKAENPSLIINDFINEIREACASAYIY